MLRKQTRTECVRDRQLGIENVEVDSERKRGKRFTSVGQHNVLEAMY